jgi:hypothetical protein
MTQAGRQYQGAILHGLGVMIFREIKNLLELKANSRSKLTVKWFCTHRD